MGVGVGVQKRFRAGAEHAGIASTKGEVLSETALWGAKKLAPLAAALALGWVLGARSNSNGT